MRWQFGDIVPDYLLGRDAACLFLSLRCGRHREADRSGQCSMLGAARRMAQASGPGCCLHTNTLGNEPQCQSTSFGVIHRPPGRYHLLKPEYIHHRIRELQRSFRLRIILCHVDTEDAVEPLAQVGWFSSCSLLALELGASTPVPRGHGGAAGLSCDVPSKVRAY